MNTGPEYVGRDCPESGHPLIIRWGRYGKFIGCSDFPKCRYTEPWLEKIGVFCPKDHGDLVERKTRQAVDVPADDAAAAVRARLP